MDDEQVPSVTLEYDGSPAKSLQFELVEGKLHMGTVRKVFKLDTVLINGKVVIADETTHFTFRSFQNGEAMKVSGTPANLALQGPQPEVAPEAVLRDFAARYESFTVLPQPEDKVFRPPQIQDHYLLPSTLTTPVYIRDQYLTALRLIERHGLSSWVFLGTPGIGKSMFAAILLCYLAKLHKMVAYRYTFAVGDEAPAIIIFDFRVPGDPKVMTAIGSAHVNFLTAANARHLALVIWDGRAPKVQNVVRVATIALASPGRDNWTEFEKSKDVRIAIVNPWNKDEMLDCWRLLYKPDSLEKMRAYLAQAAHAVPTAQADQMAAEQESAAEADAAQAGQGDLTAQAVPMDVAQESSAQPAEGNEVQAAQGVPIAQALQANQMGVAQGPAAQAGEADAVMQVGAAQLQAVVPADKETRAVEAALEGIVEQRIIDFGGCIRLAIVQWGKTLKSHLDQYGQEDFEPLQHTQCLGMRTRIPHSLFYMWGHPDTMEFSYWCLGSPRLRQHGFNVLQAMYQMNLRRMLGINAPLLGPLLGQLFEQHGHVVVPAGVSVMWRQLPPPQERNVAARRGSQTTPRGAMQVEDQVSTDVAEDSDDWHHAVTATAPATSGHATRVQGSGQVQHTEAPGGDLSAATGEQVVLKQVQHVWDSTALDLTELESFYLQPTTTNNPAWDAYYSCGDQQYILQYTKAATHGIKASHIKKLLLRLAEAKRGSVKLVFVVPDEPAELYHNFAYQNWLGAKKQVLKRPEKVVAELEQYVMQLPLGPSNHGGQG